MTRHRLLCADAYLKRAREFFRHHPLLRALHEKAMSLRELDPFHPTLCAHKLESRLKQLQSISITPSHRVVIRFPIDGDAIAPVDIGDHSIYRRPLRAVRSAPPRRPHPAKALRRT